MQTLSNAVRVPDSGRAQRLRVAAGACSVQGARRDTNEDSQYVSPDLDLFIVADGVGGHAAGEVASRFAVDVLSQELARFTGLPEDREVERRLRKALDHTNCLILDLAEHDSEYEGAKTTVVLALLLNHRLYVAGVGDSRAYLIRGRSIRRLTVDDTWPDVLFNIGQITADEAKRHYLRNKLMSALGMKQFKADKEIRVLDVYHDDRFLLASDGLTDVVDEQRLREIVGQDDDPQRAAESLTQEAVKRGAGDDVTCVVFYVQSVLSPDAASGRKVPWQWLRSWLKST
jgi:protein phosphatase